MGGQGQYPGVDIDVDRAGVDAGQIGSGCRLPGPPETLGDPIGSVGGLEEWEIGLFGFEGWESSISP
jgi:hypothetical protein